MKRLLSIFLSLALLGSLCACGSREKADAARFYYLREPDNFLYGSSDGAVTFEEREVSGHEGDVKYLLTLYLQGPVTEGLESPFPAGSKLTDLRHSGGEITVTLDSNFATLSGMDLTLACVCLARTCISLANVQTVHILAKSPQGQTVINETITIDSLLPEDSAVPTETGK